MPHRCIIKSKKKINFKKLAKHGMSPKTTQQLRPFGTFYKSASNKSLSSSQSNFIFTIFLIYPKRQGPSCKHSFTFLPGTSSSSHCYSLSVTKPEKCHKAYCRKTLKQHLATLLITGKIYKQSRQPLVSNGQTLP